MHSLKFDNLPLVEVLLLAQFREFEEITYRRVTSVLRGIGKEEFDVRSLRSTGTSGGFEVSLGSGPQALLTNVKQDLGLELNTNSMGLRWRPLDRFQHSPYPGFQSLLPIFQGAWAGLEGPAIRTVSLYYTVLDGTTRPLSELLNVFEIPPETLNRCVDINIASRDSDGFEHRIQVQPHGTSERVIVSCGGVEVAEGCDPILAMEERVHDPMQDKFLGMITPFAKKEWIYVELDKS